MERDYKKDIEHIHSFMEQSSRFISLNGLSGIVIGIVALIATGLAYGFMSQNHALNYQGTEKLYTPDLMTALIFIGVITLFIALSCGIFFTIRKSKKIKAPIWTNLTKRLLISLFIPLIAGGVFCLSLIFHHHFIMVAPTTLVFYGLALINSGKYTYNELTYLGICETVLGLIALFLPGYGLIFWALGFGLLHIIYGFLMYKKYH